MDEQEVELRDYIKVLVKWKKLIVGLTILAILISGVLSYFVLPSVYKGSALIQPSQISSNLILNSSEIQAQIKSSSFIQKLSDDLNVSFGEINSGINVSIPQNSNFVVVDFESKDKELIMEFFDKLLSELDTINKYSYGNQMDSIKLKIMTLSKQLELLNNEESLIMKRIQQLEQGGTVKSENFLEYFVLLDLNTSALIKKIELENEINDLNAQLKMSHEYMYLSQPSILDTPIKPNKKLNVVIAGVAALFFSILLAFFLEYWYGAKSENK
jgi:capsular polysaccharide biosynthesis protein